MYFKLVRKFSGAIVWTELACEVIQIFGCEGGIVTCQFCKFFGGTNILLYFMESV